MSDTMFRGMTRDGFIKFSILSARTIVERARVIHNASPVVTAALGRALIATSILGCDLKDEGSSLTMRISGDGPLGDIIAVSDNLGNVRGWCRNPLEDLPLRESDGKLDVAGIVGTTGTLSIVRDFGLGEPYTGQIDLVSGEIAEDVTAYLAVSEQIPSAC
ncbi:MAG: Hsp33 family molecular chaperone HslO, partial [Clostridia bacterium]